MYEPPENARIGEMILLVLAIGVIGAAFLCIITTFL